jgi:hypothetical protein
VHRETLSTRAAYDERTVIGASVAELWVELFCGAEMRTKTAIELLVGATLSRAGFFTLGARHRFGPAAATGTHARYRRNRARAPAANGQDVRLAKGELDKLIEIQSVVEQYRQVIVDAVRNEGCAVPLSKEMQAG